MGNSVHIYLYWIVAVLINILYLSYTVQEHHLVVYHEDRENVGPLDVHILIRLHIDAQ